MAAKDQLLAFRIKSLNNEIRRLMERTAIEGNDADLTGNQYAILGFIGERYESVSIYQRDIEAEFNMRRSTASEMLKQLERKGYIRRVSDSVDTRLKTIIMTDKAQELEKQIKLTMDRLQKRLTRNIPLEEMEQFYQTLEKILVNAQE